MPEARIWSREFERGIEYSGASARSQSYDAFDFFGCPDVLHGDDLAGIERRVHFHHGTMRIHNNRTCLFGERGFIGGFPPLDEDTNLKKQALASSPACGVFHYSGPRNIC